LSVSVTVKKCDCNILVKIQALNFKIKFSRGHIFQGVRKSPSNVQRHSPQEAGDML